jgi:anaerobic ribonucleoside-triphosphate reductase activating protein
MRYSGLQIVFQEIPNEISLAIHFTGCPLKCKGCHSNDLWSPASGYDLDALKFDQIVTQYSKYISCVVFMGGEWQLTSLIEMIHVTKKHGKKIALYTGLQFDEIPQVLISNLDYLKYGPYIPELGGLSSKTTNQRLINLTTNEELNSFFKEDANDSLN